MKTFSEAVDFAKSVTTMFFESSDDSVDDFVVLSFSTSMLLSSDVAMMVDFLGDSFKRFTCYSSPGLDVVVNFYCEFKS